MTIESLETDFSGKLWRKGRLSNASYVLASESETKVKIGVLESFKPGLGTLPSDAKDI